MTHRLGGVGMHMGQLHLNYGQRQWLAKGVYSSASSSETRTEMWQVLRRRVWPIEADALRNESLRASNRCVDSPLCLRCDCPGELHRVTADSQRLALQ